VNVNLNLNVNVNVNVNANMCNVSNTLLLCACVVHSCSGLLGGFGGLSSAGPLCLKQLVALPNSPMADEARHIGYTHIYVQICYLHVYMYVIAHIYVYIYTCMFNIVWRFTVCTLLTKRVGW